MRTQFSMWKNIFSKGYVKDDDIFSDPELLYITFYGLLVYQ